MYWSKKTTLSGMVAIVSPRPSLYTFWGNPTGSQYRACGSLVPAGLYLPIGLALLSSCSPSGVSDGSSGRLPRGTAGLEPGPAQVPVRSCFGAGPPSLAGKSLGLNLQRALTSFAGFA